MLGAIALTAGGLALLGFAGWSWAGRTRKARWWARTGGSPVIAVGILPFAGLQLLAAGVYRLAPETLIGLTTALIVSAFVCLLLGMVQPRLWMPRWYNERAAR